MAWNLYEKITSTLSFRLLDHNEILRKLKKLNYEQLETEKNLKSYQVKKFLNDIINKENEKIKTSMIV